VKGGNLADVFIKCAARCEPFAPLACAGAAAVNLVSSSSSISSIRSIRSGSSCLRGACCLQRRWEGRGHELGTRGFNSNLMVDHDAVVELQQAIVLQHVAAGQPAVRFALRHSG
jgi:hypothetical protein